MWSIWCARNDVIFRNSDTDVDNMLRVFSGLVSFMQDWPWELQRLYKDKVRNGVAEGKGGQAQVLCFEHNKSGLEVDQAGLTSFVTDGAWNMRTRIGAAARVQSGDQEVFHQAVQCSASSATAVEIRPGRFDGVVMG